MTGGITGIKLWRDGTWPNERAVVEVEIDGRWVEVIRERLDGPFSHIVELPGIQAALEKKSIVQAATANRMSQN
jgi:hypothetical protein